MYRLFEITDEPWGEYSKIVCCDESGGAGKRVWFLSNHPVDVAVHGQLCKNLAELRVLQRDTHDRFAGSDIGIMHLALDGKWHIVAFHSQTIHLEDAINLD